MDSREPGMAIISAPVDAAETVARRIVESRLAACAQVTAGVTSVYWWKGRVEKETERLILLKTHKHAVDGIRNLLREIHPYEVPELIFLPITAGNEAYLEWLSESMEA